MQAPTCKSRKPKQIEINLKCKPKQSATSRMRFSSHNRSRFLATIAASPLPIVTRVIAASHCREPSPLAAAVIHCCQSPTRYITTSRNSDSLQPIAPGAYKFNF
ncbi:hypothetical protein Adt_41593 [Abeliophyllum distichum]|uniref:Uncharacterized protein n=1 Tax=Abeliophyllum distichum TaxID=126358 RepID=A0ABD1PQ33_9LAMI